MLTTVQPRRLGGVNDRLGVGVRDRRAGVGVLALLVVVIDDQAQRRALAGVRVLEHLAVARAVAGGEDRPAADVGLDVDRLRRPSLGEPRIAALRTRTMRPSRRSNSTSTAEPTTSSGGTP